MSRTEDYRRYARECMELSRLVNTEKAGTILSHMAQVWLRLADQKNDPAQNRRVNSARRNRNNNGAALPDGSKATTKKETQLLPKTF
jgi:hypothetical protein